MLTSQQFWTFTQILDTIHTTSPRLQGRQSACDVCWDEILSFLPRLLVCLIPSSLSKEKSLKPIRRRTVYGARSVATSDGTICCNTGLSTVSNCRSCLDSFCRYTPLVSGGQYTFQMSRTCHIPLTQAAKPTAGTAGMLMRSGPGWCHLLKGLQRPPACL